MLALLPLQYLVHKRASYGSSKHFPLSEDGTRIKFRLSEDGTIPGGDAATSGTLDLAHLCHNIIDGSKGIKRLVMPQVSVENLPEYLLHVEQTANTNCPVSSENIHEFPVKS